MPVNASVHQPMGFTQRTSVALAESVGSAASQFFYAKEQEVRGIEISANHLRSIRRSRYGYCTNYSQGRTLHLWEIKLPMNLISLCKLTNIVLAKTEQIIVRLLLLIKLRFIIK
jgi:uncharacterized protein (TIGR00369 family)